MIARGQVGPVRRVSQAVLIAQFLGTGLIDFLYRLFLGNFKKTPARFLGNPLQNFLAIGTRLLRISSATATMPAHAPTHAATEASIVFALFVRVKNGVDHRV